MRLSVFHDSPELEMSDDCVNTHFAVQSATSVHCSNSEIQIQMPSSYAVTENQTQKRRINLTGSNDRMKINVMPPYDEIYLTHPHPHPLST